MDKKQFNCYTHLFKVTRYLAPRIFGVYAIMIIMILFYYTSKETHIRVLNNSSNIMYAKLNLHDYEYKPIVEQPKRTLDSFIGQHKLHQVFSFQNERNWKLLANASNCEIYHVAILIISTNDTRNIIEMIKNILEYRKNYIVIHLISNQKQQFNLKQIFSTWLIHGVTLDYKTHKYNEKDNLTELQKLKLLFAVQAYINTEKVLFISPGVRFVTDISNYFIQSKHFPSSDYIVVGKKDDSSTPSVRWPLILSVYENIDAIKTDWLQSQNAASLDSYKSEQSTKIYVMNNWISFMTNQSQGNIEPLAYWLPSYIHHINQYSSLPRFTEILRLRSIHPEVYSIYNRSICYQKTDYKKPTIKKDECKFYRKEVTNTYISHLYIIGPLRPPVSYGAFDVTLLTMLSIDRFSNFQRLLKSWGSGPVIAVLYLNPSDVSNVLNTILSADVTSTHPDVTYHVVYKSGLLTPLNYMRNLAVDSVKTKWLFFNDVDFESTPNLFHRLQKLLAREARLRKDYNKTAYVIPAFASRDKTLENDEFPKTKEEAKLLLEKQVIWSWGTWPGGSESGHKNTDYEKWKQYNDSTYRVKYHSKWEPYLIVPSTAMARYDEMLPERLMDKMGYGFALNLERFSFRVVSDLYIIHQPHPIVENLKTMMKSKNWHKCMRSLYKSMLTRVTKDFKHRKKHKTKKLH